VSFEYVLIFSDIELSFSCFFKRFGIEMGIKILFRRHELMACKNTFDFSIFKLLELAFMLVKQFLESTELFSFFTVCYFHQL